MIRLFLVVALFGAGWFSGTEGQKRAVADRCAEAGGVVDPRGFCAGARPAIAGGGSG
jgi:hypothetical protein